MDSVRLSVDDITNTKFLTKSNKNSHTECNALGANNSFVLLDPSLTNAISSLFKFYAKKDVN